MYKITFMRIIMKKKICVIILFFLLLVIDCSLLQQIQKRAAFYIAFEQQEFFQKLRNQEVSPETVLKFRKYESEDGEAQDDMTFTRYLLAYYASDLTEKNELKDVYKRLLHFHKEEIEKQEAYLDSIWSDIVYFPVPDTIWDEEKKVTFGDTWMQSRTYGGDRGHEGCDIMADINERGNYPVISVCDGTIEQMGWLELGGYRIGIRSPHGAYFYYAHLSDYAEGLSIGDEVHAGELIAFMGDTGYSRTEGTAGNFDVHLHFGIYLNDENKREFSVNSYSILQYLYQEKKILHYQY
ncbi:M23 family peptidase [Roseburia sp. AF15-21]|nr:M23 family peptidase [Roseburia sp. AF15-21]